jgi:hypothetical protein
LGNGWTNASTGSTNVFKAIGTKLEKVDERLFSMGRTMMIAAIGMSSTMVAGFGALFALIAAKL